MASSMGIVTVGFTGDTGGRMKEKADYLINVPSSTTPRIQESHILVGHIILRISGRKYFWQIVSFDFHISILNGHCS
jgi:D-sedoheptulose 7-phosphate isomerase